MNQRLLQESAEGSAFREARADGTNAGSRGRLPRSGLMRWADRFGRWRSEGSVKWGEIGMWSQRASGSAAPLATLRDCEEATAERVGQFDGLLSSLGFTAWPCLVLCLDSANLAKAKTQKFPTRDSRRKRKKESWGRGSAT